MALTIHWTKLADKGLEKVIDYLAQEWTINEILQLESKINQIIKHLITDPYLYPKSEKADSLHKAIVDKNNYLVYRINSKKSRIEIINFRGTKQKHKH